MHIADAENMTAIRNAISSRVFPYSMHAGCEDANKLRRGISPCAATAGRAASRNPCLASGNASSGVSEPEKSSTCLY